MNIASTILEVSNNRLSALQAIPDKERPKATILALPGGGYTSAYWHNPACLEASLLSLGVSLGYRVIALDRPGYGISAKDCPNGMLLDDQAQLLAELVDQLAIDSQVGAGVFLIGHSMGGILSLMVAALQQNPSLLGVDVSGVPRYFSDQLATAMSAVFEGLEEKPQDQAARSMFYGPRTTFNTSLQDDCDVASTLTPMTELSDSPNWPNNFADVAAKITVPVQYTLGIHEVVTPCDWDALNDTGKLFASSPRVLLHRQIHAGHNISLHHVGRAYHLRALAFFDEVLISAGQ